jgi:hypothetical protein
MDPQANHHQRTPAWNLFKLRQRIEKFENFYKLWLLKLPSFPPPESLLQRLWLIIMALV